MATLEPLSIYLTGLAVHGSPYRDPVTSEVYLSLPERLYFESRPDSKTHICKSGETCLSIAIRYFSRLFRHPVDSADIIAQFQEPAILDISQSLPQGFVVMIPSSGYINEVAYGNSLVETPKIF